MHETRERRKPAMTRLPSRDEKAALEAAGGDAGLARELLETLMRSLPNELAALQDCSLRKDWRALAEEAHRMRGATSYCGAPALDTCLQQLEYFAASGDPEATKLGLQQVEREAERLTRNLNQ